MPRSGPVDPSASWTCVGRTAADRESLDRRRARRETLERCTSPRSTHARRRRSAISGSCARRRPSHSPIAVRVSSGDLRHLTVIGRTHALSAPAERMESLDIGGCDRLR
jgi:hypothetical protein